MSRSLSVGMNGTMAGCGGWAAARIVRGAVGCVALVLSSPAVLACGVCVDDKVAVVYDHAVVERAHAEQHVVVFAEPPARARSPEALAAFERAAAHVAGVDRATIRIATEPAALSFALDPRVRTPAAALAAIARRAAADAAAARNASLSLLKVVD